MFVAVLLFLLLGSRSDSPENGQQAAGSVDTITHLSEAQAATETVR